MKTKLRGFTLIELMVTVAIVGILASIAMPSYLEYIKKGKRSEAEGALVTFANAMEQWRLQCGNYCNANAVPPACGLADSDGTCAATSTGSPTIFSAVVPISGGTKTYNLTISAVTATSYTLTAAPTGAQASDGALSITNTGTKTCAVATACLNGSSW